MTSTLMFFLGVTLMTAILLRRSFRYYRRRRGRTPDRPLRTAAANREVNREQPLMDAPPEVLRWQVEMHETARDLKAELNSKMSALQVLIQMATEASDRLQATIDRAERLGISECRDTLQEIERLAEQAGSTDGAPLGTLPTPLPEGTGHPLKRATTRELIFRLADQGNNALAIAQQVDAPIGEVEMILNLRPAMEK